MSALRYHHLSIWRDIHLATAAGASRGGAARRALVNAVDCKQDQEIRAEWNGAALAAAAAAAAAPFSGVLAAASATYGAAAAAAGGRADGARALAITISC